MSQETATFIVTALRTLHLKHCTAITIITVNPKAFHSVTSLFVIHTQFRKTEHISGERNLLSGCNETLHQIDNAGELP